MVPETIKDRWDGPYWRWWALGGGVALTGITAIAAIVIAALIGGDGRSLALLALIVELFGTGLLGSGMLEGLSGRAIAGGMARQPLPEQRKRARPISESDRAHRDRITIRASLIALPLLITFLLLLFA